MNELPTHYEQSAWGSPGNFGFTCAGGASFEHADEAKAQALFDGHLERAK